MYKIEFEIEGQPVGKGRPRFSKGGHVYTPQKTREYEAKVMMAAHTAMKDANLTVTSAPCVLEVIAYMRIPDSWPKVKKMEAQYGTIVPLGTPDLDNIIKAVADSIFSKDGNGPVIKDDKQIYSIKARKKFCDPDKGPHVYVSVTWEGSD